MHFLGIENVTYFPEISSEKRRRKKKERYPVFDVNIFYIYFLNLCSLYYHLEGKYPQSDAS